MRERLKNVSAKLDGMTKASPAADKMRVAADLSAIAAEVMAANDAPADLFEVVMPEMRAAAMSVIIAAMLHTLES